MSNDPLTRGFIAAQIGEALVNYALADVPLQEHARLARGELQSIAYVDTLYDDESFWRRIFNVHQNNAPPGAPQKFGISYAALTEWVARVPGLYWLPGSEKMREINPAEIESETNNWVTFRPPGKSQQVSGGVGTLRFPPSEDGFRLVTLTASYNASAGVPALIAPDVWEHHRLGEGTTIQNGAAIWREMPQKWAAQFPIVRGIPRGCLVLDDIESISHIDTPAPILIHPFSVMEYWDRDAQLHDFVYATADTSNPHYRSRLERFFEQYRNARGRDGIYLTSADISNPMWEATFADPEDMRLRKAAQLRLIEARVAETANHSDVVDSLIRKLSRLTGTNDLRRLSSNAGIDWRRWSEGGRLVDEAARLVDKALRAGKQQALLQAVQLELAS